MLRTRERTITEYVIEQNEASFKKSRRGLEKAAREIIIRSKNSYDEHKNKQWWDVPGTVWIKWLQGDDLAPLFDDYNIIAILTEKAVTYRSHH